MNLKLNPTNKEYLIDEDGNKWYWQIVKIGKNHKKKQKQN